MSETDRMVENAEHYRSVFEPGPPTPAPARKVAVVACMDARLDLFGILGLTPGDAHVIRNAGGVATDDVIRSLVISQRKLGTREIVLVHHTDCGMLTFKDEELGAKLRAATGVLPIAPARFYAFADLDENVRDQVGRIRAHPWLPKGIPVRGFVYDVRTGRLREVK